MRSLTEARAAAELSEVPNRLSPFRFVVAFGIVSLLADFVYEDARSITGP